MKAVLISLVLLGCDCDGKVCEYIRTVSSEWSSIETCQAAMRRAKLRDQTMAYPLVVARCKAEPRSPVTPSAAVRPGTPPDPGSAVSTETALPGSWKRGLMAGANRAGAIVTGAAVEVATTLSATGDYLLATVWRNGD